MFDLVTAKTRLGILSMLTVMSGCATYNKDGQPSQTNQPLVTLCFLSLCEVASSDRAGQSRGDDSDVEATGVTTTRQGEDGALDLKVVP